MEIWNFLFSLAIFAIAILVLLLLRSTRWPKRRSDLPPGPRKLPIIGNLHQVVGGDQRLHRSLQHLASRHGPIMLLKLGSVPTVVVSSAEAAREVFKSHDLAFSGRPALYAAKKLGYGLSDIAFAPYGKYWRELRKIVVLELLNAKRVQLFQSVRDEEVVLLLDFITAQCCLINEGAEIDLSKAVLTVSNNVVCRAAFGKKYYWNHHDDDEHVINTNGGSHNNTDKKKKKENCRRLDEILEETQTLLGEANLADFFPWFGSLANKFNGVDKRLNDNFQEIDRFLTRVIEEHRRGGGGSNTTSGGGGQAISSSVNGDFVDVLLRVQNDPNQAIKLTDDQIKGVILDIFTAGTDSSSATIIWTMAELIRNPSVLRRAQEEVRGSVLNGNQPVITESDLPNLPYLKMVLKESLRLHPPAPLLVPRETTEPTVIGDGYSVPAKTRVFVNGWAISRDPACWADPDRFEPERFSDWLVDFRGQDFGLIPFGAGRRMCPGMNFAVALVELVVANLLYGFDWELPIGTMGEVNLEEAVGLTAHKKAPLVLVARPRHDLGC